MTPDQIAVAVAVGAVLVRPVWRYARHAVTLVHEAGHAGVAVLTGRRLNGIRLHADTSGLTVSSGRPRGPGMVATAAAGYVAPSALGLACLWLVAAGRTDVALYVGAGTLVAMLLFIRNWFGLLVVLAAGAAVGVLVYRTSGPGQDLAVLALAWFWLIGGARTTVDLWGHRRRSRSRTSDADILANLTRLPAAVWNLAFIVAAAGALAAAVRLTHERLIG